jgi:uncharacterized RDD family membrane protein YckC
MTEQEIAVRSTSVRSGIEREFEERNSLDSTLQTQADRWRDEVASRVDSYRSRKSKKTLAGQFSMKLDFEPRPPARPAVPEPPVSPAAQVAAPPVQVVAPPVVAPVPDPVPAPVIAPAASVAPVRPLVHTEQVLRAEAFVAEAAPVTQTALPVPDAPAMPAPVREEREARIIEFPRALMFPEEVPPVSFDMNELAESILDRPRILDVPETVSVTAPPLADLALDLDAEEHAAPAPDFDLPLQVAPLPHRFTAALVDWAVVLGSSALFAGIVWHGAPGLPHTKPMLGFVAAIPLLFWAVYHYLFLAYSVRTLGMQMAGLRVSSFLGGPASRPMRSRRALTMVLSCASLGFGFLWALFDQDCLGWHDRMTRTYLTLESQQTGIR